MLLLGSVGFAEKFLNRHLNEATQGKEADFPTPGRPAGTTETTHKLLEVQQWSKATSPVGFIPWCRAYSDLNIGCND